MEQVSLNDAVVAVNEIIMGFKRRIEALEGENTRLHSELGKLKTSDKKDDKKK